MFLVSNYTDSNNLSEINEKSYSSLPYSITYLCASLIWSKYISPAKRQLT